MDWLQPIVTRRSAIAGHGVHPIAPLPGGTSVARIGAGGPLAVDAFGGLNHSCDPSLGWAADDTLVALRDIPQGTELTVDYATAIADPAWVLYCHCGTTRCRQAVAGDDWRIPQLRLRYAGHWHSAVAALMDRAGG